MNNPTSPTDLPQDVYGSESTSQTFRERYEDMKQRAGEFYDGARDKVAAGARSTDLAIRNNPYTALGLALGVGVLIGMLIARSTSESSENL